MATTTTKTTRRIDGTGIAGTPTSAIQPISSQPAGNVLPISAGGGAARGAGAATPNAYKSYFGSGTATQTSAPAAAPTAGASYQGAPVNNYGGGYSAGSMYTYEDFLNALASSGMSGQFSPEDLALAEKYPEFGMGILTQKRKYSEATTPEARAAANDAANRLRSSYGNYTGGGNGVDFTPGGKIPGQIDNVLDSLYNYGDFSYGAAPTYDNQYAELQRQLLDDILNRPDFSWTKEEDPLWASYKKSYLREGERATDNALARAAAASGGRPSSYAVNAATQAGDYYATQLNDIIPQLYQQAYQRYLDEDSLRRQDLSDVNTQEQLAYQKFLNDLSQFNADRNFSYQQYLDDYTRLQSTLGALQGQDQSDYDRYRDTIADQRYQTEWDYGVGQGAQKMAQAQVDAILQSGGTPSAELLAASGYSQEYADTLRAYYQQQIAAANAPRVMYRNSGGSSGGGSQNYDGLFSAAYESGNAKSFIYNNYKQYGFTSSSGLWDDYQSWNDNGRITEEMRQQAREAPDVTVDNPNDIENMEALYWQAYLRGNITAEQYRQNLKRLGVGWDD